MMDGRNVSNFATPYTIPLEQLVTSLSISPLGKNVVLAAKRGLFIVDLENPLDPPRAIKHNTKWEVTDVQWNPHSVKKSWIASTSNQKVLIWNLDPSGQATSIASALSSSHRQHVEHILHSHQRAVSDLNWSPFHPTLLATCSYDNYVHLWDLRTESGAPAVTAGNSAGNASASTGIKPTTSFCSWTAGATQVKWNKLNEWMLASSHGTDLRVWDIRKGSKEVSLITAHMTKIYGIDWNPRDENEVITSGQDQTVKFWNINQPRTCLGSILTSSPIWRSRFTPFGSGIVTMPQRKDNVLSLWSTENLADPVFTFAGHTDVVREFVWRVKGGDASAPDAEFQLVTWSKDQTLRLWPVDLDLQMAVGHFPHRAFPKKGRPMSGYSNDDSWSLRMPMYGATSSNSSDDALSIATANTTGNMFHNTDAASPSSITSLASAPASTTPAIAPVTAVINQAINGNRRPSGSGSGGLKSVTGRRFGTREMGVDRSGGDDLSSSQEWKNRIRVPLKGGDDEDDDGEPEKSEERTMAWHINRMQKKFPSLKFENIDYKHNMVSVLIQRSLDASGPSPTDPRAAHRDTIFRVNISFPTSGNSSDVPTFEIVKTGIMSMAERQYLSGRLSALSSQLVATGQECILPCLRFLIYDDPNGGVEDPSEYVSVNVKPSSGSGAWLSRSSSTGKITSSLAKAAGRGDDLSVTSRFRATFGNDSPHQSPSSANLDQDLGDLGESSSSDDDEDDLDVRDGRQNPKNLDQQYRKDLSRGGKHGINVPYPRLCGATFSMTGATYPNAVKFGPWANQGVASAIPPNLDVGFRIGSVDALGSTDTLEGLGRRMDVWLREEEQHGEDGLSKPQVGSFYRALSADFMPRFDQDSPTTILPPEQPDSSVFQSRPRHRSFTSGLVDNITSNSMPSSPITQGGEPRPSRLDQPSLDAVKAVRPSASFTIGSGSNYTSQDSGIVTKTDGPEESRSESPKPRSRHRRSQSLQDHLGSSFSSSASSVASSPHESKLKTAAESEAEMMLQNENATDDKKDEEAAKDSESSIATVHIKDINFLLPVSEELARSYTLRGKFRGAKQFSGIDMMLLDGPDPSDQLELLEDGTFNLLQMDYQMNMFARIDWGRHPFGRRLVENLIKYLELARDVQMLALLSCVFAEPFDIAEQPYEQEPETPVHKFAERRPYSRAESQSQGDSLSRLYSDSSVYRRDISAAEEMSMMRNSPASLSNPASPQSYFIPPQLSSSSSTSRSQPGGFTMSTTNINESFGAETQLLRSSRPVYMSRSKPQTTQNRTTYSTSAGMGFQYASSPAKTLADGNLASSAQTAYSTKHPSRPLEAKIQFMKNLSWRSREAFDHSVSQPLLSPHLVEVCDRYRICYADMLYRWGLLEKRAEVLKFAQHTTKAYRAETDAEYGINIDFIFLLFITFTERSTLS
ncbi:hypothetical protein HDU76_012391 [Blyttiomyces sp. JEL0837]|nr:hypothetical protein HDU76_012391 [Blyttiomyces sp. JEL0837]